MSIHLNAFTQCSICPQSKGQWKHPLDRSSQGYRDLAYWTEIAEYLSIGSVMPVPVGSPQHIADELERWIEEGGGDGFNIFPVYSPGSYGEFVDLVVPEPQRRGLMQKDYQEGTLREKLFGSGYARLLDRHPATQYRRTVPVCAPTARRSEG